MSTMVLIQPTRDSMSNVQRDELTLEEEEAIRQRERDMRMSRLPVDEKGLVYWEEYCDNEGLERMPTWESLSLYVRNFVIPMERSMNEAVQKDPIRSNSLFPGTTVFIEPVLRLRERMVLETNRSRPRTQISPADPETTSGKASSATATKYTLSTDPCSTTVASASISNSPLQSRSIAIAPSLPTLLQSINSRMGDSSTRVADETVQSIMAAVQAQEKAADRIMSSAFNTSSTEGEVSSSAAPRLPVVNPIECSASTQKLAAIRSIPPPKWVPASNGISAPPSLLSSSSNSLDPTRQEHDNNADDQNHDATRLLSKSIYSKFKAQDFQVMTHEWTARQRRQLENKAPIYKMGDNGVSSVLDVLEEWRFGFQGGPAIQDLNRELGLHWIGGDDGYAHYLVRQSIIQEYLRLVSFILRADIYQGVGTKDTFASEYAVRVLEERQGSNSIVYLSANIPNSPVQSALEKRKHASQGSRTESRKVTVGSEPDTKRGTEAAVSRSVSEAPPSNETLPETQTSSTPFPFPVRDLRSVRDVWMEWTEGWEGEPSLQTLINIHSGELWKTPGFYDQYFWKFYPKKRVVQIIRKAVADGAVGSTEEAVRLLEQAQRPGKHLAEFYKSAPFKALMTAWGMPIKERNRQKKDEKDEKV